MNLRPDINYYVIQSRLNGQVLSVEGEHEYSGQRVVINHLQENWNFWGKQLWSDDHVNRTIRSKQHGHCLDMSADGAIVVNHYDPIRDEQRWERYRDTIRSCNLPDEYAISIAASDTGPKVTISPYNEGANQKFDFLGAPGFEEPYARREFFIVSEMNGKVMDIRCGDSSPGTLVIAYTKKSSDYKNQLWYFDSNGIIHSALNDLVPQSRGGAQVKMERLSGDDSQQWTVVGNRIVSKTGACLDIREFDDKDGAAIISYGYKASSNQHWRLEYV